VVCGAYGVALFDALHRRGRVSDAILRAFDLLELDGVDYRPLPLRQRKDRLARLLACAQVGIALNEHTDAKGELVFRQACAMGLEGIVSKRLTVPYKSGPSRDWIKVKNPDSPAMIRAREGRWSRMRSMSLPGKPSAVCYAGSRREPMSIDAEEAAIRTVIVSALMGHAEAGERGFDALFAMRQSEAIVKALKIGGYEIKRVSR
jgi:hypothetical protein